MDRGQLIDMAKHTMSHAKAGTMELVPEVMKIPASFYTDPARFDQEVDKIFKRVPLMLAPTCEIPNPGDYKTLDVAGIPVLMTRGKDGVIRSFLNSCAHRGTNVATEATGNASRFVCPYHGWTFNREGKLIGIASSEDFGHVDKDNCSLTEFPTHERAGLIWVTLDPNSPVDFDAFLAGYDEMLSAFEFENWHFFSSRQLVGPNWKIAYDGYLDFYHLPVLHANTFGTDISNRANFHAWGPHQRVVAPASNTAKPDENIAGLEDIPEDEWPVHRLLDGVWTIFPHISIASFYGGSRGVMLSQLLPGDDVSSSITTQMYLMAEPPSEEIAKGAHEQFDFLEVVVRDEDYATGIRQQRALEAGFTKEVYFGRNEGGGQAFHGWVNKLLDTPDDQLNALFSGGQMQAAE